MTPECEITDDNDPPDADRNEDADAIYAQWIAPMESRLAVSAWRVLRCEQTAADVLQDAMARIWKHRKTLQKHPNPNAWMLRVVLNATCDYLRRRPQEARKLDEVPDVPAPRHAGASDGSMLLDESRQRILDELASLSPQQAEAVMLRLVEDLSYQEVAAAIGCSITTARVHVNRGREKLRTRLNDLDPISEGKK